MRILLVDDHPLFAQGLKFLLADLNPALNCLNVGSVAAALVTPGPLDLILLDYNLPDSQGPLGLERVREAHDGVPVVMLSGDDRPALVHDLISRGAAGFVPKSAAPEELLQALQTILAGGTYLPAHALSTPNPLDERLSQRQLEVLMKLVQGKPNKVIALELEIAESTIKTHLAVAFKVLGVSNRTEAVFKAAALGLTPPPAG